MKKIIILSLLILIKNSSVFSQKNKSKLPKNNTPEKTIEPIK